MIKGSKFDMGFLNLHNKLMWFSTSHGNYFIKLFINFINLSVWCIDVYFYQLHTFLKCTYSWPWVHIPVISNFVSYMNFHIWYMNLGISYMYFGIWYMKLGIWFVRICIWISGIWISESGICIWVSGLWIWESSSYISIWAYELLKGSICGCF